MKRNDFNDYIQHNDFVNFFNELGWNHVNRTDKINPIEIEEGAYEIIPVADKHGFKALICSSSELPQHSVRKKIDFQLRKYFHNYILIFIQERSEHHLWMIPIKTVEKRDIVVVEYECADKADFLYSKINDFSFGLEEETNIVDVTLRIHKAFEVNSSKVTKDFYSGFRKEHKAFAEFIEGIHIEGDRQWYTSVMLNRLMFCYFIQKKGFLNFDHNYLRNKLQWTKGQQGDNQFFGSFYKGFLRALFHGGLNSPKHSIEFTKKYGRIPYLNGGVFDEHELEQQYADIDIADEAFEKLFDFFDKWRWHLDTRIEATGKDINPDVLGYIFEQYINDRAQMGAYYTKEDITEYIGKNCILPFLMDETAKTSSKKHFTPGGYVWETLRNSGDTYIYDAVKKGMNLKDLPEEIEIGLDTEQPNLLERRKEWNKITPKEYALPTEIWRETIERRKRYIELLNKIRNGKITEINDFITYNLDIRRFVEDLLAETTDHLFILHFYNALQRVTILDPTCGSGAFLFAALNILEPLYEICIIRMQEFNASNSNLFKDQLNEIEHKYRSNIQYFIYKSIILRNLYGVDIMHEAVEIAKLRLFLKMVAVVDVDKRSENLGLDPLPDIDFNIRCGNTLVGYATEEELDKDLNYGNMFDKVEFKERIDDEMQKVALAYDLFKQIQFDQQEDMSAFKAAKNELNKRLQSLNKLLNTKMFGATQRVITYDEWNDSYQPFHWLAEYYQIIKGNGGFDVIIGNPPYVVYTESKSDYKISKSFKTYSCSNLYAYCIERSELLLNEKGKFGMIVPNSSISADKLSPFQKIITENKICWISHYAWRPSKLFEGANMLLAIIINTNSIKMETYSSRYYRWYNEYRSVLFETLAFSEVSNVLILGSIPKIVNDISLSILNKMRLIPQPTQLNQHFIPQYNKFKLYYFRAVLYWFKVLDREPIYLEDGEQVTTGEMKPIYAKNEEDKNILISFLSSSLYFSYYVTWSSCQVVNSRDFNIFFNPDSLLPSLKKSLIILGERLQKDYQKNSRIAVRTYSKKGRQFTMNKQYFYIKKSKNIIDNIDIILSKYYGFTEEELDFIINYDIKYRMGSELDGEDE